MKQEECSLPQSGKTDRPHAPQPGSQRKGEMGTEGRLTVVASGAAEAQENPLGLPKAWQGQSLGLGLLQWEGQTAQATWQVPCTSPQSSLCVPVATQEDPVGDISEPLEVEAVLRNRRGSDDHPGLWPRPLLVFLFP